MTIVSGFQSGSETRAGLASRAYSETDVVNTYRLWLIYELFRGAITPEQLVWSERQLRDYVR